VSGAARGILVAGTVAGAGGFAHVTASGGLEPRSLLLAVGLTIAVGGSLVRRVRWTFARALAAAVAAQSVLHVVLEGGGHAGGHAHAAHHAAATSADERMWILHRARRRVGGPAPRRRAVAEDDAGARPSRLPRGRSRRRPADRIPGRAVDRHRRLVPASHRRARLVEPRPPSPT